MRTIKLILALAGSVITMQLAAMAAIRTLSAFSGTREIHGLPDDEDLWVHRAGLADIPNDPDLWEHRAKLTGDALSDDDNLWWMTRVLTHVD